MKKNILNSLLAVLIISTLFSCKAKKELVKAPVTSPAPDPGLSKREKLDAIGKSQAEFSTIAIKARAALNIDNNSNDVTMNIRIKKDEAIWVSVTAVAGLEVARALITPDSVKILNRLENVYIKKPFSYIYGFTNEQINFGTLQSILVGNTIKEFVNDSSELAMRSDQVTLSGTLKSVAYTILLNGRNKVIHQTLEDDDADQSLMVNYGDFVLVSSQEFPQQVDIRSQAVNKSIRIDLRYARVDLNENVEIPFNVPKRFSVKN